MLTAMAPDDAVGIAPSVDILDYVDLLRLDAARRLRPDRKSALGQYFTPPSVARLMASMADCDGPEVMILDAGAGVGSLFAALVEQLCQRSAPPASICVTAYEVDEQLAPYLSAALSLCERACVQRGISFVGELVTADFLSSAVDQVRGNLFSPDRVRRFNCAVLNPPYRKIHSQSGDRRRLRQLGIETSNLYAGFVAAAIQLLVPEGEIVAITPRSFCNGPYFRPFREALLSRMTIRRLHVFESRQQAFSDDDVLQENIILHAISSNQPPRPILVTSSEGPDDEWFTVREMQPDEVVQPRDPQRFIHLVPDIQSLRVRQQVMQLPSLLHDLGLSVSTGRVVDFRAAPYLRALPESETAPLIYPSHLGEGYVNWPKPSGRKPNALVVAAPIRDQFVPNGTYVLVKRFTAKEETRRIVAAIHDSAHVPGSLVAFENHLNYFHCSGKPLTHNVAYGLATFLNSSLVDAYFRQFNGHTQVNATDLRSMRYPSLSELEQLGKVMTSWPAPQTLIDQVVGRELAAVAGEPEQEQAHIQRRLQETLDILGALELPRAQRNERSALTLLALLALGPDDPWSSAKRARLGITPMMNFFARRYGRQYAPNTRETVRRQTVHQFMDAGLLIANPDDPDRPINSPHTVYELERGAVNLLRTYGTPDWTANIQVYLASLAAIRQAQRDELRQARIPVALPSGRLITLSAGGQNTLIRLVVEEFAPRFTPGGEVLYLGDAEEKWEVFEQRRFVELGIQLDPHGKMPDVVVYHADKNWLVLVEAVTSHGPVDAMRRRMLASLFTGSSAGLVFVTAFSDRRAMIAYLQQISWETEVWVADAPSHLIHFDGERFLGPHNG